MKKIWLLVLIAVLAIALVAGIFIAIFSGDNSSQDGSSNGDISVPGDNNLTHQHSIVIDDAVEPTCLKTGLTEGKHCSECNEVILEQMPIPVKNHIEGEWVVDKEATSSEDGIRHQVCILCGTTIKEEMIPMTGALEYVVNSDGTTCTVVGIGSFKGSVLNIPEYLDGYKVTVIGDYAFQACDNLVEVVIPEGVTSINEGAFAMCLYLTSVTIPESVNLIGDLAFCFCAALEDVVIPNGVKIIGSYAFEECASIKNIVIPESVTDIYYDAFYSCSGIESITVAAGNETYHSAGNCLIETANKRLILGCKNSIIPMDGSVERIVDYAFYICEGLTQIVIPASVKDIDSMSFYACNSLVSIKVDPQNKVYYSVDNCLIEAESKTLILGCKNSIIPTDGSVTSIGSCAFLYCTGLKNLNIPKSIISIGWAAFDGCSGVERITVESGNSAYRSVGNCLIDIKNHSLILGCATSVIPNDGSVKIIASSAFYGCSGLTSIIIPNGVTSIGDYAFYNCINLTSIVIPDSVSEIGSCAFMGCVLKEIVLSDGITMVREGAFAYCNNLVSVVIPDSVVFILDGAFAYCEELTSVVIPDSVMFISNSVFEGCNKMTYVYYGGTAEQWKNIEILDLNDPIINAEKYYYSGSQPTDTVNKYWHYVSGEPIVW